MRVNRRSGDDGQERQSLPIDALLPRAIEALRKHPAMIVIAAPGAGKTTRLPPAMLTAKIVRGALVLLQPRRVAARAAARRIAAEQGWKLGQQVGYQVRFDRQLSPRTPNSGGNRGRADPSTPARSPRWAMSEPWSSMNSTSARWKTTLR